MMQRSIPKFAFHLALLLAITAGTVQTLSAQSLGSAGTVTGVVVDPNGAVVPNASVTIANPVTGYTRTVNTGSDGSFRFTDVPPNTYSLGVSASGFNATQQRLEVRTSVPMRMASWARSRSASGTIQASSPAAGSTSAKVRSVCAQRVPVK